MFTYGTFSLQKKAHAVILPAAYSLLPSDDWLCPISTAIHRIAVFAGIYIRPQCNLSCEPIVIQPINWVGHPENHKLL